MVVGSGVVVVGAGVVVVGVGVVVVGGGVVHELAPAADVEPAEQFWQTLCPVAEVYLPASQKRHSEGRKTAVGGGVVGLVLAGCGHAQTATSSTRARERDGMPSTFTNTGRSHVSI